MKIYTNSKGESLPKVICAVVEFENKRLDFKPVSNELQKSFTWFESNIFGEIISKNVDNWKQIDKGNYDCFYEVFPTCKNSRGQELPEDIQVEIVEERLRQGINANNLIFGFNWRDSVKGDGYWREIRYSDYSTKSDDTFTQGEIVEVSNRKDMQPFESYLCFQYIAKYGSMHVVYDHIDEKPVFYEHCRKHIQPL